MKEGGLITMEQVTVVRYARHEERGRALRRAEGGISRLRPPRRRRARKTH